jgi:DsbC/DsbD-like thiol-disulfide interchange protein
MTPRPGWHCYWSNPGDSGIAPTVRWSAPKGVTFGPLLHPAPTLLTADGMSSFVHEGRHVLLSRLTIARSIAPGTAIPITAALSWAACTATQCVPLHATLSLQLTAGDGARGAEWRELNAAAAKLPRQAPGGSFVVEGRSLQLLVPAALKLDPSTAHFFADEAGVFHTASARLQRIGGAVRIAAPAPESVPPTISGVLSDGRNAYRLSFDRRGEAAVPAAETQASRKAAPLRSEPVEYATRPDAPVSKATAPERESRNSSLWLLLGAAILGLALIFALRRASR